MQDFANPDDILDTLNLYGPVSVADFGCGSGFFSLAIAKRISAEEGTVYALDIQKEPLRRLRKDADALGLHHIKTICADLERPGGSHLKDSSIDTVLITHVLFQAPDKKALIREAFRILRNGGTLVVIEWNTDSASPLGPRKEHRITKEYLAQLLTAEGFQIKREFRVGDHHNGIILVKPS